MFRLVLLVEQFLRIALLLSKGAVVPGQKALALDTCATPHCTGKGRRKWGIWCDRRLTVADSGQEHYSSNNPSVTVVGCHRDQRLLQYLFCRPFYRPFRHLLGRGRHRAPILVVLFTFFAGRLVSHGSGLSLTLRLPRVPYAPTHRRILLLPQLKRWSRFVASVIYPFTAALNLMRTPVLFRKACDAFPTD